MFFLPERSPLCTPLLDASGLYSRALGQVHRAPRGLFQSVSHLDSCGNPDSMFLRTSHIFVSSQRKSFCPICPSLVDWLENLLFLQEPAPGHSPPMTSALILWAEASLRLFNAYVLSTCHVPGTGLGAAGITAVNQTDKNPSLWELTF